LTTPKDLDEKLNVGMCSILPSNCKELTILEEHVVLSIHSRSKNVLIYGRDSHFFKKN